MVLMRGAELLVASAMLPLLGLRPFQIVFEAVELFLPSHAIVLDPVGNLLETSRVDTARAPLGSAAAGDKSSVFKNLKVLRDGRQAHLKGLGELGDRGFTRPQVSQNGSTGGVGKSGEGGRELLLGAFASHLYLTDWLN